MRFRRIATLAALAALVALAGGLAWWRLRPAPAAAPGTRVPPLRGLAVRFTGGALARYRPLVVGREAIALAGVTEPHERVAALAAIGELAGARAEAARLPADAASAADRAAVALASGDVEGALAAAYRGGDLPAARWNFALAAEQLGLVHAARAAFAEVAAAGEPGWSAEARARAAAFGDLDAASAVEARGERMVAGGPVLVAADVAIAPGVARYDFYDAARVAPDRARLAELAPLAAALDRASGLPTAAALLARVDPAAGAQFGARYRKLVDGELTRGEARKLADELRAAHADDLYVATLLVAGVASKLGGRSAELRALVAPWHDPWLDLAVVRFEALAVAPDGDPRVERALLVALVACTGDTVRMRCAQLAVELARVYGNAGRDDDAERQALAAADLFRRAGAPEHAANAFALAAEVARHRDRTALARARADDVALAAAAGKHGCIVWAARITAAAAALADDDRDGARRELPPAADGASCRSTPDVVGMQTAIELALRTRVPADAAIAERWLEHADPGLGAVGAFRLAALARPPGELETVALLDDARRAADSPNTAFARAWAIATAVAAAGGRGDWAGVFHAAAEDTPIAAQAPCAVVASVDGDVVTIAVRVQDATRGTQRTVARRTLFASPIISPALAAQLSGCAEVAVVASPPLHARADLLPPQLAWWFAGPRPGRVRTAEPPHAVAFTAGVDPVQLASATYAELRADCMAATNLPDAAFVATLGAGELRAAKLQHAPVVALAGCRGAAVPAYLQPRWTLPDAFLAAGASAVVAFDTPVGATAATRVLDELHRLIDAGEAVASAAAALRTGTGPEADAARHLIVFR